MPALDWNKMIDRQTAGKKFLVFLISNPKEREKVLNDPKYAREIFAREGGMSLPPEVKINAVANNPGGFYVNVHNAKHLGGAMRGQLKLDA